MKDHPQRDYAAAKLELPKEKRHKDTKTFGTLAKDFLKTGLSSFGLMDKSEKYEYKQTLIKKYTKIINSYILLKGSPKV
ncbi:hypothetical protein N9430_01560 [Candidatus Pelagibacter sp.]|nr:hypothetical protein [Candidatus Pelagibacter sp.]